MFANPLWSVAVLAAVILLYILVIRPRLRVAMSDTFTHIDGFWGRLWARVVAFRSYVATCVAAVLIAAPDLLVALAPVDLSPFIGEKWAPIVSGALAAFLALNRALSTKPDGQPS